MVQYLSPEINQKIKRTSHLEYCMNALNYLQLRLSVCSVYFWEQPWPHGNFHSVALLRDSPLCDNCGFLSTKMHC